MAGSINERVEDQSITEWIVGHCYLLTDAVLRPAKASELNPPASARVSQGLVLSPNLPATHCVTSSLSDQELPLWVGVSERA